MQLLLPEDPSPGGTHQASFSQGTPHRKGASATAPEALKSHMSLGGPGEALPNPETPTLHNDPFSRSKGRLSSKRQSPAVSSCHGLDAGATLHLCLSFHPPTPGCALQLP